MKTGIPVCFARRQFRSAWAMPPSRSLTRRTANPDSEPTEIPVILTQRLLEAP